MAIELLYQGNFTGKCYGTCSCNAELRCDVGDTQRYFSRIRGESRWIKCPQCESSVRMTKERTPQKVYVS